MSNLGLSLRWSLMLLAVGLGHPGIAQTAETAGTNPQQEIKALQGQVVQAILRGDTSVLERLYADDYIAIHGDGVLTTKAQEIENLKFGVTRYQSITIREAQIRLYGSTAVVNALATVRTVVNGKPYGGEVRNTRVWVKEGASWKLVVFQATRVTG